MLQAVINVNEFIKFRKTNIRLINMKFFKQIQHETETAITLYPCIRVPTGEVKKQDKRIV